MSTETTPSSLVSYQTGTLPDWLTAHRLKRGVLLYWAALFTLSSAIIHFLAVLLQRPQSGFLAALILIGAGTQAISAVSVMVWPARLLLIAAGVVNGLALLLWLLSHTTGLPVGLTLWRAEFPSVADMWLPIMEGTAAIFFFSLAARTWSTSSRTLCIIVIALPYLFLLAVLILASLNQVTMAIFFIALLTADGVIPSSRRYSEKD